MFFFANRYSALTEYIISIQPGYSLRTFTGHSTSVMSLDFHPNKDDLICSCDGDGEIRYWSINNGSCVKVSKVENLSHDYLIFLCISLCTALDALQN